MSHRRQSARLLRLLVLILYPVGCGAGGGDSTSETSVEPQFPGIAQFLNIDPDALPNYADPTLPRHYDAQVFAQFDNTPIENPITDAGATLGRVLFYDPRLSINDTVSCASCHAQDNGFTDEARFSVGFNGIDETGAHSMRLGNARFFAGTGFFWDQRATSLEDQATQPIRDHVEMGFDVSNGGIEALIAKMTELPYYPELFEMVFGDPVITEDRMQRALAQFVRSMLSTHSRFDDNFALVYNPQAPGDGVGATFPGFTAEENRGKQLFTTPPGQGGAGCAGCHPAPTFSLVADSGSNGLDAGETTIFRSPSLKNVARTGPYMHDGRFDTLAEVVDHYADGVQLGPAVDRRLRGPGGVPQRLNLDAADRQALVAFLRTLDDPVLVSDSRFSDPFVR